MSMKYAIKLLLKSIKTTYFHVAPTLIKVCDVCFHTPATLIKTVVCFHTPATFKNTLVVGCVVVVVEVDVVVVVVVVVTTAVCAMRGNLTLNIK